MKLFDRLKQAAVLLADYPDQWAICGGVAASIYRSSPRFTDDIDIAVIDSDKIRAVDLAAFVISEMGLREYKGFVPDPKNGRQQINALLMGRESCQERFLGLDFLLPVQAWIEKAVELAQSNQIDYGFAHLPTVTPECLIVAKLAALEGSPERYQDLDDIKEIVKAVPIDREFLGREIAAHKIKVSREMQSVVQPNNASPFDEDL